MSIRNYKGIANQLKAELNQAGVDPKYGVQIEQFIDQKGMARGKGTTQTGIVRQIRKTILLFIREYTEFHRQIDILKNIAGRHRP